MPGTRDRARQRAALAVLAAALAALAAAMVILPSRVAPAGPAPADPRSVQALAAWITSETDAAALVEAPDDVRASLARGGVPPARFGVPASLVVTRGAPGPGRAVARFGDGPAALIVTRPGSPADDRSARAARAGFGAQLANNAALTAPPDVRAMLADGRVDPRALLVLAGLAALGPFEIVAIPAGPAEDAGLPRHRVAIAGLDPARLDWIRAQRPPLAPELTIDGPRVSLTWPVPAPPGLIGG